MDWAFPAPSMAELESWLGLSCCWGKSSSFIPTPFPVCTCQLGA